VRVLGAALGEDLVDGILNLIKEGGGGGMGGEGNGGKGKEGG
jgi:hypothetical protein